MSNISDAELDEMIKRCEAASPPPWTHKCRESDCNPQHIIDYDFIASARSDLPRVIQALKEEQSAHQRSVDLHRSTWDELRAELDRERQLRIRAETELQKLWNYELGIETTTEPQNGEVRL